MSHIPVLLDEVVAALAPAQNEIYVDGTFGGGGYTRAFLEAASCQVVALDRDLEAIARGQDLVDRYPGLKVLPGCFGDMAELLSAQNIGPVAGVILDIGVSSFQIDQDERGFSFMRDGPLDMRMGQAGPSAADIVNAMAETDLANIIFRLGEERQSRRIARSIAERRIEQPIKTTLELANIVEEAVGGRRGKRTHPATLTFQALRMYVNDELGELARGLAAAERILAPGGRLIVVTFHSLEDRLVKRFFRERSGADAGGSRYRPERTAQAMPSFELINRKAIEPSEAECVANPRARSARLRGGRRTMAAPWAGEVATGVTVPSLQTGAFAA
ncbi:MAG: 16S rRNA (cytosine(1402)-N(4))-methyltransferase RsmH [Henriciella sp.]